MDTQIERLLHGVLYKQLLESRIAALRERYDLRKVDIEVLYYLSRGGGKNTSTDIKAGSMLTKSHISQSVDRMQKMRLLELIPDENDRRCVHLALTERADEIVKEIAVAWEDLHQTVFAGVTKEEEEQLKKIAARMEENMERALRKLQE